MRGAGSRWWLSAALIAAVVGVFALLGRLVPEPDEEGTRNSTRDVGSGEAGDAGEGAAPVLAGRVTEAAGDDPIADASVVARCGEGDVRAVRQTGTDDRGRFAFPELPEESCAVGARAEGWLAGPPRARDGREVRIDPDEPVTNLRLTLHRAAGVRGRVVDGDGEPLDRADVTVVYDEVLGEAGPFSVTRSPALDARGAFRLDGLMPGRAELMAEHPELGVGTSRALRLDPGEIVRDVTLRLEGGGTIAGRVLDEAGTPVARAEVRLYAAGASEARRTHSDDAGRFAFDEVSGGRAQLAVTAAGYEPARGVSVRVVPGEEARPTVRLDERSGFEGLVRGPRGDPVPRAAVFLQPAGAGEGTKPERVAVTDERGRFHVERREGFPFRLHAVHRRYARSPAVRLDGPDAEPVLRLRAGGQLVGRVVDPDREPVTSYHVRLLRVAGPGPSRRPARRKTSRRVRDERGRFRLEGLAPGRYRARISAPHHPPKVTRGVEVEGGRTTDLGRIVLDAGAAIEGRVVDASDGEGLEAVRVEVSGSRHRPGHSGRITRTSARGRFRLDGVEAKRLSLRLDKEGYRTRMRSGIEPRDGERTDVGRIELTPSRGDDEGFEYGGVGMRVRRTDEGIVVADTFSEAPAARAGLEPGTRIVRIGERSVDELGLRGTVEELRGRRGSRVEVEVRRPGADDTERVVIERRRVAP